ncbi:MAG: outer membrane beta-barrel protein [Ignavibacteriales bacterium]
MFKKYLALMIVLVFVASEIKAQGIGIGPQLGWQKSSSADNGALMYGAALRVKLSPAIGIEGSINYRQEKYADGGLTVRSWPVMVTGLIYPIPVVYGAIGVGWYNTTFDYSQELTLKNLQNNTTQNFGWHLGGGLELPLGKSAWLTGDIRYVFLNYDFGQLATQASTGDLSSNFFVITVGLLFGIHN